MSRYRGCKGLGCRAELAMFTVRISSGGSVGFNKGSTRKV